MLTLAGYALVQLAALGLVFGAVEWCYPNRADQPRLRPQLFTDLAFYFGQHLVWLGLELSALWAVASALAPLVPAAPREWMSQLPWPAQALVAVAAGDVLTYWYHRASHAVPWLWAFHRVHHTSPRLDWLAAHREHPVDGLLTQCAMNLPALLLGISLQGLVWLVVFRGVWAAFIHANVRLPLGPLRLLVGAPELHHWHHAAVPRTLHNFSNLAPWTDLLFGTYHCPPHQDHELGLPGQPQKSYLGWLLSPHRD
ncbi:MAG TPA: sterol desaturase family protein [Kofleriaceae bacterium]|nr:sterol desaturase family protein [Kofleriaceae bacterium]